MRIASLKSVGGGRFAMVASLVLLAFPACNKLHDVTVPDVSGPSALGTNLKLTAAPDVIVADGFSTAAVQAAVYDQNGRPAAGRTIYFTINDSTGINAAIGTLSNTQAITASNGVAQVIYTAPVRTDATANQTILVAARPLGDDAQSALYRTTRIELRSAEPRLFPPRDGNKNPTANFVTEPAGLVFNAGQQILFQSTSSDPDGVIVRFQWDFGDGGEGDDKSDVNHSYDQPGSYTVTLVVTDNNGGQGSKTVVLTIK